MRRILEMCITADELARDLYASFASHCTDDDLSRTFRAMSREEDEHVSWWMTLVEQWDRGLLPDLYPESGMAHDEMLAVLDDVCELEPDRIPTMTSREMLEIAAKLEFFLLDPVFGDLLELGGPATAGRHREAYEEHLVRLISAIELAEESDDLTAFLARVLRRAWESRRTVDDSVLTHDRLTGMVSRQALLEHLRPWAAWTSRYGRTLAIVLIDVDRLGDINRDHGQSVGDRVLTEVGKSVRRSLRESDLVARYGGDEFIVLMPEALAEDVRHVSERILRLVRKLSVPSDGTMRLPVSVSIGSVVVADHRGAKPRPIDEILAAADSALHDAKAGGRDRVAEPMVLTV